MAVDNRGSNGRPIFLGTGAPATGGDLSLLGSEIYERGTRLTGTLAERDAYRYPQPGLLWYDEVGRVEYIYDAASGTPGWRRLYEIGAANYGPGWGKADADLQVYRYSNGSGFLVGRVARAAGNGTEIAELPPGFRPLFSLPIALQSVNGANAPGPILHGTLHATGKITFANPNGGPSLTSATWVVFNLWFPIGQ